MLWLSRMRTNERTRLRGSMGLPVQVVNTRPVSAQAPLRSGQALDSELPRQGPAPFGRTGQREAASAWAPPLVELAGAMIGHLLGRERHERDGSWWPACPGFIKLVAEESTQLGQSPSAHGVTMLRSQSIRTWRSGGEGPAPC
jgi:hypothetical protein